jgi:hypothetical protein
VDTSRTFPNNWDTGPGVPTGLTASTTHPTEIDLAWTAPAGTDPAATYNVYQMVTGNPILPALATGLVVTNYAVTGLPNLTSESFAVNSNGVEGALTAPVTGSTISGTPIEHPNLRVGSNTYQGAGNSQVHWIWDALPADATGWQFDLHDGAGWHLVDPSAQAFLNDNVAAGSSVTFSVAYVNNGVAGPADTMTVTAASAPSGAPLLRVQFEGDNTTITGTDTALSSAGVHTDGFVATGHGGQAMVFNRANGDRTDIYSTNVHNLFKANSITRIRAVLQSATNVNGGYTIFIVGGLSGNQWALDVVADGSGNDDMGTSYDGVVGFYMYNGSSEPSVATNGAGNNTTDLSGTHAYPIGHITTGSTKTGYRVIDIEADMLTNNRLTMWLDGVKITYGPIPAGADYSGQANIGVGGLPTSGSTPGAPYNWGGNLADLTVWDNTAIGPTSDSTIAADFAALTVY